MEMGKGKGLEVEKGKQRMMVIENAEGEYESEC